jgi:hypothetical protein
MWAREKITLVALFVIAHFKIQSQPLHEYFFNNNLNGTQGGPQLIEKLGCGAGLGKFNSLLMISSGGICSGSNVFCFDQGGGLEYPNPNYIKDEYTINVFCKFNNTIGKFRLLDFSQGTTDPGIYLDNSCLSVAPIGTLAACPFLFSSNQFYLFTFVRTAPNNILKIYVDGALFGTYNDLAKNYALPTTSTSVTFFKDDSLVSCEAKAGGIKYTSVTSKAMLPFEVFTTWTNLCGTILSSEPAVTFMRERPKFHPNPADKTIDLRMLGSEQNVLLKNIFGQEVGVSENGQIDTASLPEGVYYLTIDFHTYSVIIKH